MASTPSKSKGGNRLIGRVFADRYEIQEPLGKGGMAVVYKALDRSFHRPVAVKVLRTDVASDPVASKRLVREAQAAGGLHHPHIITMHDVGVTDGLVFVVMELLQGRELSALMDDLGQISVARSLEIARQVAAALAVAHDKGIVHRDIKPENLFCIETDGTKDFVKVLDFSIAKLPKQMVTAALTRAGSVFGTPHYMAPEQVEGKSVCPQTDLYALGAVLFECIAGFPPFDGDSVIDILMKQANDRPPLLSDCELELPNGLSELIDQMLSKSSSNRPASAREVEKRLAAMAEAISKEGSQLPRGDSDSDTALPEDLPDDVRGVPGEDASIQGAKRSDLAALTIRGVGLAEELKTEIEQRSQSDDSANAPRVTPPPSTPAAPKPVVVTAPTATLAPKPSTKVAKRRLAAAAKTQPPPTHSKVARTESADSHVEPDRSALSANAPTQTLPERLSALTPPRPQAVTSARKDGGSFSTRVIVTLVALLAIGIGLYLALS